MPIRRLSLQLANQIAAGEVVERPASVVKELVENAVDAKASSIVIEIKNAGKQLIKVSDNGQGIVKDELPLALAPHATSKIASLEDLEAIVTLGFRGEALASIASVSKLTLVSNTKEQDHGYQVEVSGLEQHPAIAPAAHPVGTSVIVRELFFNTPARRRFLKSDKTEFNHIKELLIRLALVNYQVEFKFISDGKVVFMVPAHSKSELHVRIGKLLGAEFKGDSWLIDNSNPNTAQAYINFLRSHPDYQTLDREYSSQLQADPLALKTLRIHGLILKPESFSKTSPDKILTFLNGRAISDRTVNHALREAYLNAVQKDLDFKPSLRGVIFMECDPYSVDVNVHPRKDEVRFHNANLIYDCIVLNVKAVLDMQLVSYSSLTKGSLNIDYTPTYVNRETCSSNDYSAIKRSEESVGISNATKSSATPTAILDNDSFLEDEDSSSKKQGLNVGVSNSTKSSTTTTASLDNDNFLEDEDSSVQSSALFVGNSSGTAAVFNSYGLSNTKSSYSTDQCGKDQLLDLDNIVGTDDKRDSIFEDNNLEGSYNERLSARVQTYLEDTKLALKESRGGRLMGKVCALMPDSVQDQERRAQAQDFISKISALNITKPSLQETTKDTSPVSSLDRLLLSQELARSLANKSDSANHINKPITTGSITQSDSKDLQCLSLVTADVLLIYCAQRYFVVRGSELAYEILAERYSRQVLNNEVESFILNLPFAIKCSAELLQAFKDASLVILARRCGFTLKVQSASSCLELSAIPQLLVQSNVADSASQALSTIATFKEQLTLSDSALSKLSFIVARAKRRAINSEYEALKLCQKQLSLRGLDSLVQGRKAYELNLLEMAATLLK